MEGAKKCLLFKANVTRNINAGYSRLQKQNVSHRRVTLPVPEAIRPDI
jgi:hypothetical protein